MWKLCRLILVSLILGTTAAEAAAPSYPSAAIHIVVPYPPGGATDQVARLIGNFLSSDLKQPVIIENKAGGSSVIGTNYVVAKAPDGYTLLMAAAHLVTNVAAEVRMPYEPLRDLVPVANVVGLPMLVAVNPKIPARDLNELIAWVRKQDKPVLYASPGAGTLTQLWGELLAQRYGLRLQAAPYKGSTDAARAVAAGDVPLLFDVAGVTGTFIRDGRLRGIVTPGSQRAPGLPDVPSAREAGVGDLEATSFIGLLAPAKLPAEARDKLNASVNRALQEPSIVQTLATIGLTPAGGTPDAFADLLRNEVQRWTAVARRASVRATN